MVCTPFKVFRVCTCVEMWKYIGFLFKLNVANSIGLFSLLTCSFLSPKFKNLVVGQIKVVFINYVTNEAKEQGNLCMSIEGCMTIISS